MDHVVWGEQEPGWLFMLARAEREVGEPQIYLLPLALVWEDEDERAHALQGALIARVRQQARIGGLADAFADDAFCHTLVTAIGDGSELRCGRGTVRFRRTGAFAELAGQDYAQLAASPMGAQSSNTLVVLGDRLLLKAYRRLRLGVNPEFEVGTFLTDVARFQHSVPIAGAVEYVADDGTKMTLALLQGFVSNQGDAWSYTINYVEQFLDQYRTGTAATGAPGDVHGGYLALIRTLGRRTAELHVAFATPNDEPGFVPEPIDERDVAEWVRDARGIAEGALDLLERRRDALDASAQTEAIHVLARRAAIVKRFDSFAKIRPLAVKTRLHGDYHLGQVLLAKDDFVITDFEGEPLRSVAERRRKHSVMRDVASMLRSFNYARHQALAHAVVERPDALASLAAPAQAWEEVTRSAFLDAYRETAKKHGLFEAWQPMRGLIDLFMLEKAFYELAYEVDHRPDWLRIALAGIRDLLAGADHD